DALAHLGPAVADLDAAVAVEADDRPGHLLQAVPEARVLEPEAESHRLAGGHRRVPVRAQRLEAVAGAEAAVVHDLPGAPHGAGRHDVARPHLPGIEPARLGQPVDQTLGGELRLVGPEAPE